MTRKERTHDKIKNMPPKKHREKCKATQKNITKKETYRKQHRKTENKTDHIRKKDKETYETTKPKKYLN